MNFRPRRRLVVALTAGLYVAALVGVLATGLPSFLAASTFLVAVVGWAYGFWPAAAAMVLAHPVSFATLTAAGIPGGPPSLAIMVPAVGVELVVAAVAGEARRSDLRRAAAEAVLRRKNAELAAALAEVKELRGMLPICAWCKSIRDVDGMWDRLEGYLSKHSCVTLTHGVCPGCLERMEADLAAAGRAG